MKTLMDMNGPRATPTPAGQRASKKDKCEGMNEGGIQYLRSGKAKNPLKGINDRRATSLGSSKSAWCGPKPTANKVK